MRVPGEQDARSDTCCTRRLHVGKAIPKHDGSSEVQAEILGGPPQHSRLRLPALAITAVLLAPSVRMMRAVVDGVERGAVRGEFAAHPVHISVEVLLAVIATGDTRLIGNDDDQVALHPRCATELEDALDKLGALSGADIAMVDVDDAIAVEKQRLGQSSIHHPLPASERPARDQADWLPNISCSIRPQII